VPSAQGDPPALTAAYEELLECYHKNAEGTSVVAKATRQAAERHKHKKKTTPTHHMHIT
jgi:hypothetical protein